MSKGSERADASSRAVGDVKLEGGIQAPASTPRAGIPMTGGPVKPLVHWKWLAVGWVAAMAFGALYAIWLQDGSDWNVGAPWERSLMYWLQTTYRRPIDDVFLAVPWIATHYTLIPIILGAAAWLKFKWKRNDLALQLVVVEIGTWTLNQLPKALYDRDRPQLWEHRGQYAQASYPSGHAIAAIAVLVTIAAIAHRERGWKWPYAVVALVLVVNLYSRLYLGVHWPSDVIAGIGMGGIWLLASLKAFPGRGDIRSRPASSASRPVSPDSI
ncbi:MAG: phosphatase PAP2 family protein [Anaerolineae bacterium]|nr:phosphatase PAP2 family protein [Gemmatimonadaceae bacterium]